jgi:hypothetical protein
MIIDTISSGLLEHILKLWTNAQIVQIYMIRTDISTGAEGLIKSISNRLVKNG